MSARTFDEGFGSLGLGDPMGSFSEKTYRVSWDFSKKNVKQKAYNGGGYVIPLLQIPRGLCIDRVSVVQTKAMSAGVSIAFGLKSDDSVTIGGSFSLASSGTLLRASRPAKDSSVSVTKTANNVYVSTGTTWTASDAMKLVTGVTGGGDDAAFASGDDVICMIVPDAASGAERATFTEGAFDLCIHGFETFAEAAGVGEDGKNAVGAVNYRQSMQTMDNVGGEQFPLE